MVEIKILEKSTEDWTCILDLNPHQFGGIWSLYHVSPHENRESIRKNGLIAQAGYDKDPDYQPEGVYGFDNLEDTAEAHNDWFGPADVWKASGLSGKHIWDDPNTDGVYHDHDIPPEKLTLVRHVGFDSKNEPVMHEGDSIGCKECNGTR